MHNIGYAGAGMVIGMLATSLPFGPLHACALAGACLLLVLKPTVLIQRLTLALAGLVIGGLLYQYQIEHYAKRSAFYQNNTVDVVATVDDLTSTPTRQCLWLTVTAVRCNSTQPWQKTHDRLALCTKPSPVAVGDTILVKTVACTPDQPSKHGLVGTAFFASAITVQQRQTSILGWFTQKRNELWRTLSTRLSAPTFHLFSTIFLGKNHHDELQDDLRTHFVRWGLAHYLARSGIHLIMVLLLLNALMRILFVPLLWRAALVSMLCMIYSLLSWPSIPFIRALFAVLVYQGCVALKVPIDTLHVLHLTLLYCLVSNPASLFFLDFQLTFALTYTLIVAMRRYKK